MTAGQRASAVSLLVASLLAAAACGDDGTTEPTAFEELGLVGADGGEDLRALAAETREVLEDAAACMRSHGFPYTPWSEIELIADSPEAAAPPGTPEYAAERGYGIMWPFPQAILTHPSANSDPNQPYLDGLTDAERTVFHQTLYGAANGLPRADSVDRALYNGGGCVGDAFADTAARADLTGVLLGPYEELEIRVNADDRLLAYDEEWSACMAEQGFRHESSPGARSLFRQRFDELWLSVTFPADAFSSDELRALGDAERAEIYAQEPAYDRSLWEQWRAEEIDTAVADVGCQGDEPREELFLEVLAEHEDSFLAENASVVEQLDELDPTEASAVDESS